MTPAGLSSDICRYPDPLHYEIKEQIAKFRNIPNKEQIFLGVGSDEAIDILFRIFCHPQRDNVVITPPTYGMYKVCAKINDVAVKSAPLTPEFEVDMKSLLSTVDESTKLLFLCSPGNPTARVIPRQVIEEVAQAFTHGIIVIDEAYIDFNVESTAVPLLEKYPNLVVLQTLSKAFGLAGIRLGMAIASSDIIQLMNNVKAPYNINKLTAKVALEAFQSLDTYEANVRTLLEERAYLSTALQSLPAVQRVYPSDANFILFSIPRSFDVYKRMADRGVVCRYRGNELHCTECLRVTVGSRAENDQFLNLLQEVVKEVNGESK